jgi:bifunctional non-homologous end joining protein LigD
MKVDGRDVRVTNLDKVYWPATGHTKGHVIEYYVRVGPAILPHLVRRPLTLHRFPEGVDEPHFYETRCPPHPEWVRTQRMHTFRRSGKVVDACIIDDLPSLVWAAHMAAIELHPYLAPVEAMEHPLVAVFDLDPGPPAGLLDAGSVALEIRAMLDDLGLASFAKVSGGKGMHVYVPVGPGHTYDRTKAFARAVATLLAARAPERVVDRMTRSLRTGKVFVDWSQNDAGKSTVAPYSLRGMAVPLVSAPVGWDEIEAAVATGDEAALRFGPLGVLERVERDGELFEPVLSLAQVLPEA